MPRVLFANHLVKCGIDVHALASAGDHEAARSPILRIDAPQRVDVLPFHEGWAHEWVDSDSDIPIQIDSNGPEQSGYVLRFPGQCEFLIDPDEGSIGIVALRGLDAVTLEHLLIDQALPRMLAHMGHCMVHASLVRIGAGTALFLGRSGWGKSTLAGLLNSRGHAALCDDCALLDLRGGRAVASPAYPGLRLYNDSIQQVFSDIPATNPVAHYTDKQRVAGMPGHALGEHAVNAIYLLTDPAEGGAALSIDRLAPAAACMALVEHSFRLDPSASDQTRLQLGKAASLAQAIPAFSLRYPRDFSQQDDMIRMLLEHVASVSASLSENSGKT